MNDLLRSTDTIENALKLQNDIIGVLKTTRLELRKWYSNIIIIIITRNIENRHGQF